MKRLSPVCTGTFPTRAPHDTAGSQAFHLQAAAPPTETDRAKAALSATLARRTTFSSVAIALGSALTVRVGDPMRLTCADET